MTSIGHTGQHRSEQNNRWLTLLGRILLPLGLFAIALFGAGVNAAHAQSGGNAVAKSPQTSRRR